ncbi:hypothetical protein D3C85_924610 [compost metagenome]
MARVPLVTYPLLKVHSNAGAILAESAGLAAPFLMASALLIVSLKFFVGMKFTFLPSFKGTLSSLFSESRSSTIVFSSTLPAISLS